MSGRTLPQSGEPPLRDDPPHIGRYTCTSLIARGGLASVYRARDPAIGREVALKVTRCGNDVGLRLRALHEGEALGALKHAGLPTVYDWGVASEEVFVAMELVDGGSLERYAGRPAPLEVALELVRKLSVTLLFLASRQIVHRDVKPANILVRRGSGEVVLIDLNIARSPSSAGHTGRGGLGTWGYGAPEQWNGTCDQRTDLYAVARVFEFLLTGDNPGPDTLDHARLPEPLRAVLAGATHADPSARPPDLCCFLDEVDAALQVSALFPTIVPLRRPRIERAARSSSSRPIERSLMARSSAVIAEPPALRCGDGPRSVGCDKVAAAGGEVHLGALTSVELAAALDTGKVWVSGKTVVGELDGCLSGALDERAIARFQRRIVQGRHAGSSLPGERSAFTEVLARAPQSQSSPSILLPLARALIPWRCSLLLGDRERIGAWSLAAVKELEGRPVAQRLLVLLRAVESLTCDDPRFDLLARLTADAWLTEPLAELRPRVLRLAARDGAAARDLRDLLRLRDGAAVPPPASVEPVLALHWALYWSRLAALTGRAAAGLEQARAWLASTGSPAAHVALVESNVALLSGNLLEAEARALCAVDGLDGLLLVNAYANAAAAALELGTFDKACERARSAEALARALESPHRTARAVLLHRAARHRAGQPVEPDPALTAAIASLGTPLAARGHLLEALLTRAAGDGAACHRHAERAVFAYADAAARGPRLLAKALALTAGPPDPEAAEGLAAACVQLGDDDRPADIELALQALGLIAGRYDLDVREGASHLYARVPPDRRTLRLELCRIDSLHSILNGSAT